MINSEEQLFIGSEKIQKRLYSQIELNPPAQHTDFRIKSGALYLSAQGKQEHLMQFLATPNQPF